MADKDQEPQEGTVDPADIPPADSNEQLGIAHEKREAAFARTASAKRRKAATEAKASSKTDDNKTAADRSAEARTTPPEGRTGRPTAKG